MGVVVNTDSHSDISIVVQMNVPLTANCFSIYSDCQRLSHTKYPTISHHEATYILQVLRLVRVEVSRHPLHALVSFLDQIHGVWCLMPSSLFFFLMKSVTSMALALISARQKTVLLLTAT